MDDTPLKDGCIVLLKGMIALSVSLAFPNLRIEWLAIVAASASLSFSLLPALAIVAALAWVFSAFSLSPAWQIFVPLGIAIFGFHVLRARINAGALGWQLFLMLCASLAIQCSVTAWYSGDNPFAWHLLIWPLATWLTGIYALPLLGRALSGGTRLFKTRKSLDSGLANSRHLTGRQPFGFEKGI